MTERALIVINPNASQAVTDGIDTAVAPFRRLGLPIRCVTLAEGPPGIETQAQADETITPILRLAKRLENEASGYVIACFGDPGMHALRDRTTRPVIGIQEAAVMTALTIGQRFGVIAILPGSVPRHLRAFGAMGVTDRLAADRALNLSVADLADADTTVQRMIEVGRTLKDTDGADVLIMGCAGMAAYRDTVQEAVGLPVVEPCQAAVGMAISRLTCG